MYYEKGIDVFNEKDEFFNDICYPFNNNDKTDIVLNNRREDIFQNFTFCQEGCSYNGINYNSITAYCICDTPNLQEISPEHNKNIKNNKISLSDIKSFFLNNILNYNVIMCYKLLLKFDNLKNNYGFISMSGLMSLQIILLFIFLFKGLKPIKHFMYVFMPSGPNISPLSPPPKSNKKNKKMYDLVTEGNNSKEDDNKKEIKKSKLINKSKSKIKIEKNENEDIKDSRNKNLKEENHKIKTNIYSMNKKIGRTNDKKFINLNQKTTNIENNNANKLKNKIIKFRRDNIINSNIFNNIHIKKNKDVSDSGNKILSNNEGENICDTETILKDVNNKENYIKIKNSKLKPFEKKNKLKFGKKDLLNKSLKLKEKITTIKETDTNLNSENINKINIINQYKNKIVNITPTKEDFLYINYYVAINLDKRSCIKIFWSFLVNTQIILGIYFTSNYLNLFVIKFSFLLIKFQINFFCNALFYTDKYISDTYYNNGKFDIFSGILKSIYSFLVTLVITCLLSILINSKSEIVNTIRNRTYKMEYLRQVNSKLKKLRNKLIVYYIILIVLGTGFLYYVSAFCAVYRNTQKYWLIGCLETFIMDFLCLFGICLFLSLFRYISLQRRIKCLYNLSRLINIFI